MFESQTHNNNDSNNNSNNNDSNNNSNNNDSNNNNSNNNDKEKQMSTTYLMHEDTFQYRVFCSEI